MTASPPALLEALGLYAGTFLVATLSSIVPLVAIEVFLVGVAVAIAPAVSAAAGARPPGRRRPARRQAAD